MQPVAASGLDLPPPPPRTHALVLSLSLSPPPLFCLDCAPLLKPGIKLTGITRSSTRTLAESLIRFNIAVSFQEVPPPLRPNSDYLLELTWKKKFPT